jgi:hypothetical protein
MIEDRNGISNQAYMGFWIVSPRKEDGLVAGVGDRSMICGVQDMAFATQPGIGTPPVLL